MNSSTEQNSKASSFYAGIQRFLLRRGGGGAPKMKDNFVFQGVGVHGLFLFFYMFEISRGVVGTAPTPTPTFSYHSIIDQEVNII